MLVHKVCFEIYIRLRAFLIPLNLKYNNFIKKKYIFSHVNMEILFYFILAVLPGVALEFTDLLYIIYRRSPSSLPQLKFWLRPTGMNFKYFD
jgi:hypothetical protein